MHFFELLHLWSCRNLPARESTFITSIWRETRERKVLAQGWQGRHSWWWRHRLASHLSWRGLIGSTWQLSSGTLCSWHLIRPIFVVSSASRYRASALNRTVYTRLYKCVWLAIYSLEFKTAGRIPFLSWSVLLLEVTWPSLKRRLEWGIVFTTYLGSSYTVLSIDQNITEKWILTACWWIFKTLSTNRRSECVVSWSRHLI
jgi:hypothetical protein